MATKEKDVAMVATEKEVLEEVSSGTEEVAKVFEDEHFLDAEDPQEDLEGMEFVGLMVSREKFVTKDKKKYWGYHVNGIVRGRNVRVSLTTSDAGGYEVLDIVFEGVKEVPLWRSPFTVKDNDGKITMSGFRYFAVSQDEEGMIYSAQVKPSRKSDQAMLEMMIKAKLKLLAES